jgi:hypothetical protein
MDEIAIEAIKKAIAFLDLEIAPHQKYLERLDTLRESRDALKVLLASTSPHEARADGETPCG